MPIPPLTLQRSLYPFPAPVSKWQTRSHEKFWSFSNTNSLFLLTEGFLDFLCMHFTQHCFLCRHSDFAVSEDAGIEPSTSTLAIRRSSHSATSHPLFCFSDSFSMTFSACLGIATRLRTPPPWCQLRSRPWGRLCLLIRPRRGIQLRQPAPVRIPGHRR